MNLDKLMTWVVAVVPSFAVKENIDCLQKWILHAQAKTIYESRSSAWGTP